MCLAEALLGALIPKGSKGRRRIARDPMSGNGVAEELYVSRMLHGLSGHGRFCCRSRLPLSLNSDFRRFDANQRRGCR